MYYDVEDDYTKLHNSDKCYGCYHEGDCFSYFTFLDRVSETKNDLYIDSCSKYKEGVPY